MIVVGGPLGSVGSVGGRISSAVATGLLTAPFVDSIDPTRRVKAVDTAPATSRARSGDCSVTSRVRTTVSST